ncbi:predicted protein [Naegleria gruberi]|uniref:Predicted protein n=1 Tax=Naegleria gruberi TaxID=5762 RepID=D2VRV0_NAEGR|nr:uncharacterized protein NAEGRDRAFT_71712 [Naegleria gruberi]EFC40453.1 predicted protein [Naegleria gruberi]|eukprot:XP_002673197.1 predicted protein [Naegleria gruberi strain NEG-M]
MLNIIHSQGIRVSSSSSLPSLVRSNSTLFSMLNSFNQVTSASVSIKETSKSEETTHTNWYHLWAFLAILLDYVSVIFNVFPVSTTIENTPSTSSMMTNEELEYELGNQCTISNSIMPRSLSPRPDLPKNSLEVFTSEFYFSLFASGGIESNENLERMVNSFGNLVPRHDSIYSQSESSEDDSSSTSSIRTKHNNEHSEKSYQQHAEVDALKSTLNLFKFPKR